MIVILGPTATGKTKLAAEIAYRLNAEIISADSRQVYKNMTIGSGKDYNDYIVNGFKIPYHLVDIVEPGYEYNIFEYKKDFLVAYNEILSRNKKVILCGGSGMYLESVISKYRLDEVPINNDLRKNLCSKSNDELVEMLSQMKTLHNITDSEDRDRIIRAIEIETYMKLHPEVEDNYVVPSSIYGIRGDREFIRQRITDRLYYRLENQDMVGEVERLLDSGVDSEKLKNYGLEYKFLTKYILGEIPYEMMVKKLNIAIHQFSKRQMTWFRRMERKGFKINWIDVELPLEDKVEFIFNDLKSKNLFE
ncbi:MAG: tRNA (adenosine(37)-N6)-dimethylallyltransferase MiaA [Bacteroidales bacterium]|jgi:tRNA dimethylallyltransferase